MRGVQQRGQMNFGSYLDLRISRISPLIEQASIRDPMFLLLAALCLSVGPSLIQGRGRA